jgi:hypothetical protein
MQQIGGKIGFGFGEYVEICAVYLQSRLKTSFSDFGIAGYKAQFQPQDLTLTWEVSFI